MNPVSGWPVTATGKNNVSKVREIIESDGRYPGGRYTIHNIAKVIDISLSRVHFILECIFKVWNARWITHVLSDEQKKATHAKSQAIAKNFPKFNQRQ